MVASKRTYELDGSSLRTLEDFYFETTRLLFGQAWRECNLDAFDDLLDTSPELPEEDWRLIWRSADASRIALGYAETVRQLTLKLAECHPLSQQHVAEQLAAARAQQGPTVFDWLVDIFRSHTKIELVLA